MLTRDPTLAAIALEAEDEEPQPQRHSPAAGGGGWGRRGEEAPGFFGFIDSVWRIFFLVFRGPSGSFPFKPQASH